MDTTNLVKKSTVKTPKTTTAKVAKPKSEPKIKANFLDLEQFIGRKLFAYWNVKLECWSVKIADENGKMPSKMSGHSNDILVVSGFDARNSKWTEIPVSTKNRKSVHCNIYGVLSAVNDTSSVDELKQIDLYKFLKNSNLSTMINGEKTIKVNDIRKATTAVLQIAYANHGQGDFAVPSVLVSE